MSKDTLDWLTHWYLSECDSEWEHGYGVRIETLDNPGWMLKIDLKGTHLEGKVFETIEHGEASDDLDEWRKTGSWWIARLADGSFDAACGPLDLPKVIEIFRSWAE